MPKKKVAVTVTGKWQPFHEFVPVHANAFRLTWGEDGIVFTIGLIDPEYFLPGAYEKDKPPIVRIIGRFNLGYAGFVRLREEINKAHGDMIESRKLK